MATALTAQSIRVAERTTTVASTFTSRFTWKSRQYLIQASARTRPRKNEPQLVLMCTTCGPQGRDVFVAMDR
jgi:hypothetical protein